MTSNTDSVQLLLGDALERLREIGKVDAIITDPPYSSGARRDAERQVRGSMLREMDDDDWFSHDTMTTWGFGWFMRAIFSEARSHLSDGAHLYVFSDWRQTPNVYAILESCGYRVNHCLVWRKAHYGMGIYWRNQHENIVFASLGKPAAMVDRGMGSVLDAHGVSPMKRKHVTEKPVELLMQIVRAIPSQHILDPFMGSGSTGVAALSCGRKFTGIEIDEATYRIAQDRLMHEIQPELFT